MSLYDKLQDFGTLVYTVGDGSPPDKTGINALSRANAHRAAELTQADPHALLFIAGGNGGERGKRGDGVPGSLQEAPRMVRYIRREFGDALPVITDCEPDFAARFSIGPSMNTIENGRNAAMVLALGEMPEARVVAERIHLFRVIGTLRRQLANMHIPDVKLEAHPVNAEFEKTNDQWHIRSRLRFILWDLLSCAHHLKHGEVKRAEFLREFLTFRRYKHLRPAPQA